MIYADKIFFNPKTQIIIRSYLIIIICIISVPFFAQNKADSLTSLLKKDKEDTGKVNHLNLLAMEFRSNDPDTTVYFAKEALRLAEKNKFQKGVAEANLWIGTAKLNLGEYEAALKYLQVALVITDKISNKNISASVLNNIGVVYFSQGNYPDALKNHLEALKTREEIRDKQGIAKSYINMGAVYYSQGNYPEALKNYFAALKIKKETGEKRGMSDSYTGIGNVYSDQGNYPGALKNYFACLKIMEETGNKRGMAACYSNIGGVYAEQGNYSDALKNYFACLKQMEETGDKQGVAASYNNIGNVYVLQHKSSEGKVMLEKGLRLSREIGSMEDIKESYKGLANTASAQNNYKYAYENYMMYIVYRDSLLNEENTKKTVQQRMQYEFDKKESFAKAEQEKKDFVNEEEKQKQKIILLFTILGFGVAVVVALFIFRNLRINKKKNRIISLQKEMVERQKYIVEEKQKEILDSIHYARRIQTALLPGEKYIERILNTIEGR